MKKIIVGLICGVPLWATAYSYENISQIHLEMNHNEHAYNIVYLMDDSHHLVANLTAGAKTEYRAHKRIYDVTKNIPQFRGINQEQIQDLFNWEAFSENRERKRTLIDAILRRGSNLDTKTIVKLLITREIL